MPNYMRDRSASCKPLSQNGYGPGYSRDAARRPSALPEHEGLPGVSSSGVPVPPVDLLQEHFIQRQICYRLLQPVVLLLEPLESFRLVHSEPPLLLAPPVRRGVTDPGLLHHIFLGHSFALENRCLTQFGRDLFCRVLLPVDTSLLQVQGALSFSKSWTESRGSGQLV